MSRLAYNKLVPSGTFIADYMLAMDAQETSYAYDFWCACWCMSVALGRSVVVARPRAPVHLNLYTILAAESGVTRKSTAVRFAASIVQDYLRLHAPHTDYIGGKTNADAIEIRLAQQALNRDTGDLCICVSELVTFMGKDLITMTLPGLITDLYDCPAYRPSPGTVRSGTRDLKNVYVTFLSASTPSWLMRSVHADVIEGGFTSRCLFIVEEQPKRRIVWPDEDGKVGISERLVSRLAEIGTRSKHVLQHHAGITISEGGLRRLTNWYRSRPVHLDPYRASFEAREDHHILRLAAFLCINDGSWIIQDGHVRRAIQVINHVKEGGAGLFSGATSQSKIIIGIDRARRVIIDGGLGGVTQTELLAKTRKYLDTNRLEILMNAMHELGLVQRFERRDNPTGKATTIWRGTKAIAKTQALDAVRRSMEDLL